MNIEVKGCDDCPMFDGEWKMCSHPKVIIELDDNRIDWNYGSFGYLTPEWCPLKKESITITLKEDSPE